MATSNELVGGGIRSKTAAELYSIAETYYKRGRAALMSGRINDARVDGLFVAQIANEAKKKGLDDKSLQRMLAASKALLDRAADAWVELRQIEREKVNDMAKAKTAAKKTPNGKAKKNAQFEGMCKWKGGYVKQERVGARHVVTVKTGSTDEEMFVKSKKEADELFQAAIATEKK